MPFDARRHKKFKPACDPEQFYTLVLPALDAQRTTTATPRRHHNAERNDPGTAKVWNAVGHKMAILEDWHMYRRASHFSTAGNQKTVASVNKRCLPGQTSSHLFLTIVMKASETHFRLKLRMLD